MDYREDINYLIGNIVNNQSYTRSIKIAKLEELKADVNRIIQAANSGAYNYAYDNDLNPMLLNTIQIGIISITKIYLQAIEKAIIDL